MALFIIIQARMTSTRLPGKVLLPLCNKTILEIMIDRLKTYKKNIIIATTNDGSEEKISNLCNSIDIKYYEGDTKNVLSRYYEASKKFGIKEGDTVVRCTSDCPLIDEELLSKTLAYYKSTNSDYVSIGQHCGYPRGMDIEIFDFTLLKEAYINAKTDYEKEHVTPYLHTTIKNKININYMKNCRDDSKYRLTVDEEDDYKAVQEIYKKFNDSLKFSYNELITMLELNEYIYDMNKHIEQKKK